MAGARLPMRKIRDVLRLTAEGMSSRKIAASLSIGATTVVDCQRRARAVDLGWPLPEDMTDEVLEARLFPASTALARAMSRRPIPDWASLHRELKRPGVTLLLLWEEYRERHPDGVGYSWFCEIYQTWKGRLTPTMRQTHIAGERMFVDYAGKKPHLVNPTTGELIEVELFVAVLGASNLTYAEATWTQTLADWIGAHTRAFAFFGGVAALTVIDNLRAGITKACFYEPQINRTYADMAKHYRTVPLPARPNKPRDKAKVEVGVQIATRWIIAKLRNRTFFSLSPSSTPLSASASPRSTNASRATSAPAAARCSSRSSAQRSSHFLPSPTSSRNGRSAAPASTTTSRSSPTSTRCRSR